MSSSSSTIPGIIVAAVIAGIMVFAYLNKDTTPSSAEHAGHGAEHAGHSAEHAGHAAHSSGDEHTGYSGSIEGYLDKFSK
jgi:hypothetical protein